MKDVSHVQRDLVFPSQKGTYRQPSILRKPLLRCCKVAGIDKTISSHALRRTANDLLRRANGETVARAMIGHATSEMTRLYSHVDHEEKAKAHAAAFKDVLDVGLHVGLALSHANSESAGARRQRKSPDVIGACWSGKRDSNPRHPAWEADALPTELFPRTPGSVRTNRDGVNGSAPAPPSAASGSGRACRWSGMRLRSKLVLAIVGGVLLTTLLEGAAGHGINLKMASYGARTWLRASNEHGVRTFVELQYEMLEQAAKLLPPTISAGDRKELEAYADAGRFWAVVDGGRGAVDASAGACSPDEVPLGSASGVARGVTVCGTRAALTVSVPLDPNGPGRWLVLGRFLDAAFLREIGSATNAEVALYGPAGVVEATTHNAAKELIAPVLEGGAPVDVHQAAARFAIATLRVPGYLGYQPYDVLVEPVARGELDVPVFLYVDRIPGLDAAPLRAMVWVPQEVMGGGGYYVGLVAAGTLLVLPLVALIAWLLAARIARPISALARAARRLRDGDLDVRAPAQLGGGEVEELGRAFDAMVAGLEEAQARALVSEKMAAIGQLAGGVAHEINNPLGVILGFAQGLERRVRSDDPLRMPVESIVREALRCRSLVQELLVFSRTGKREMEGLDVSDIARATVTLLEARARPQGVELRCALSETAPVHGNRTQIQQVMVNLGTNALDAMPEGGVLTIGARQQDGHVIFEVSDTGTGIDEALRTRIFDPFFTTKEVGKGTGLGLSLVHEIVKQHGGAIYFTSAKGRGTTMVVSLPPAPAMTAAA